MNINGLIEKIAEKKGLQGVSKDSINSFLSIYLKKHKIKEQNIESLSEKEIKSIVKDARAHLRILVGRFHLKESKKNNLLKKKDWAGLLNTHTSTKERIDIYPEIKRYIQSLHSHSILDLGCGLNPIAIAEKGIYYYASDINNSDLEIVSEFFKDKKITGKIFQYDLINSQEPFPKADITLMFKLVDFLEKISPRVTERVFERLDSKDIIVSFSTHKLSGKRMGSAERKWFENLCFHKSWSFKKMEFNNEVFYHISRK